MWTAAGPVRPVRWIGWRRLDVRRHPDAALVQPIRILADAFAPGVPRRDVRISPDHAVLVRDVLVPARLLVNGATIVREDTCRSVTYYHVELDSHDVLLAECLPVESYLDTGNRGMFENANLPLTLFPHHGEADDQARRVKESCVPLAVAPADVKPLWQALAERARTLGFVLPDVAATTTDPVLRLEVGGQRLQPITESTGHCVFVLTRTNGGVRLVSLATAPNELQPWHEDRRKLGVMVRRLTLRRGGDVKGIPVDDPRLHKGWWAVERDGIMQQRWTNGSAELPLEDDGPVLLDIEFDTMPAYRVAEAEQTLDMALRSYRPAIAAAS